MRRRHLCWLLAVAPWLIGATQAFAGQRQL